MLAALSWLGRLSWPLIGSLAPGISPRLAMNLATVMAVLAAVGGPAGAVWLHMHGARSEAVKTANAKCELRIADGARISAESLTYVLGVIKAGEEAASEPKTKAEERALCRKSKLCRENGK